MMPARQQNEGKAEITAAEHPFYPLVQRVCYKVGKFCHFELVIESHIIYTDCPSSLKMFTTQYLKFKKRLSEKYNDMFSKT